MTKSTIVSFFFLWMAHSLIGQSIEGGIPQKKIKRTFEFMADLHQKFGFDALHAVEWQDKYPSFKNSKETTFTAFKSIGIGEKDLVFLRIRGVNEQEMPFISFQIGIKTIPTTLINDSTFQIELPPKKSDYYLKVFFHSAVVAKLNVRVFEKITEKVVLIPLKPIFFTATEIEKNLNTIFCQANIQLKVTVAGLFRSKVFESASILSTPEAGNNQYTGQMRLLRDLYLEQNPKEDKDAYFVFVLEGFEDSLLNGFMVNNKSIGFLKIQNECDNFSLQLARVLSFGMGGLANSWESEGPPKGSTDNLMDTLQYSHLTYFQWDFLRKTPNYYSLYDNDENVRTNNGTVAYYFWEEDKFGFIKGTKNGIFSSIKKPFKNNYLAYRFKVKYFILKPLYKIGNYFISILDFIFLSLVVVALLFVRKKIRQFWSKKKIRNTLFRKFIFIAIVLFTGFQVYDNYWVTNKILYYFKIVSGPVPELNRASYSIAKREIVNNERWFHQEVSEVCSEIFIQKNKKWHLKKRAKVLYFSVTKDENGKWNKYRFVSSSNKLRLKTKATRNVDSHYIVLNFRGENGKIRQQKVLNYYGNDVGEKINEEDQPKRILVFVNGYRPTSLGQTFEENFSDIRAKGLEFPNSKNFIYDFDRYDYWQPWQKINLQFQKRLNPNETFYADGHFSVTTSNYRSLINFSSTAAMYPKRCENPKKHTCHEIQNETFKQFIMNGSKSINQLNLLPNHKGFLERKNKGKIAGKNLLQLLNNIPGHSKNDTLYLIAHSMGFAYSLGIVEVLRGKVNFGEYYIIAPENGRSGRVHLSEWKKVWQYGSNFNRPDADQPCLQDGIAPQTKVAGLKEKNRIYIPEYRNPWKGFFDAHFIGYYSWILDIPENEAGFMSKK
jgi:hypothetical protein